jgi:iron complex outermembrane receptor protein
MVSRRNRFLSLAALIAVLFGVTAYAQSNEGRITGVVRDASGAAVPGATITVTNQATNATTTATSGADGSFAVSLLPGTYSVTVSIKGFGPQTQRALKLSAGGAATADFSLQTKRSEEITVTAMKREETVQNTPVSVAAPTEGDLRARGVDSLEGVAANVAGFNVQNLGPGQNQVAVRGVSSGQIARDQPGVKEQVGAYLDESVISLSLFTPDIDLFDMNRVEVLRGPQGTLFGSGSESGTVRYITNQPELKVTKGFAEFGGNTVHEGNQGGDVKLGFNAPVGDTAALRVVGFYTRMPGFIDTPGITRTSSGAVRPDPGSLKKDVNTGDRTGGRAAIKIAPNDRLTVTPRFLYQKVHNNGFNRNDIYNILANPFTTTRPPVTLGPLEQFVQLKETFDDKFYLGDLNINYNFGSVALTSISSYTHRDIDVVRDGTQLTGSITGGSIGLPENVSTLNSPLEDITHAKVFTEELRLSGSTKEFRWVLGGFYANTKRDYSQNLPATGFTAATGIPTKGLKAPTDSLFFSDLHYKLDQYAAFGEGTWDVDQKFSLTGGLRYYHFSDDKSQFFDGFLTNPDLGKSLVSQPGKVSANGVVPRFIASYKVSDTTNLNAQASKGFRLGGVNDPLNLPICTPADRVTFGGFTNWKNETDWNYEVGSKSRVMGGRGSFNISAFDIEINDLQAIVTAGSCSSRIVFNVPKARSQGVEVEFAAAPNSNFDFSISGSYNDSKQRSTVTSTAPDGSVTIVSGIQTGERLPSVTKFQMAATATYQWQMRQGSLGYLTGTFQHQGSRYTQVGDQLLGTLDLTSFGANAIGGPLTASTFKYDPLLPAYDILNARLGVIHGKWDVALFGNNLTDKRALLGLDRERGTRARIGYLINQPRTFGLSAKVDF